MKLREIQRKMRADWDQRARENARHFIQNERENWNEDEFYASGEEEFRNQIASDLTNICQGQKPEQMAVLEIGCGAGRVTRALAQRFGRIIGVDISPEMIAQARIALASYRNVQFIANSGTDLNDIRSDSVDFAFSTIVFQHIPSYAVIESYVREVHRVLRTGRLFKFQVQGDHTEPREGDSWDGVSYTLDRVKALAESTGFRLHAAHGEGQQYFWLWFFKR